MQAEIRCVHVGFKLSYSNMLQWVVKLEVGTCWLRKSNILARPQGVRGAADKEIDVST